MFTKLRQIIAGKATFLRSVGIYGIAGMLEKAIPFLLLPVLTRLLSTYDYGVLATFNALRLNLHAVLSLSTSGAVGRAFYDRRETGFNFPGYTFNALVVNTLMLAPVLLAVVCFQDWIPGAETMSRGWLIFIVLSFWATALASIRTKLWVFEARPAAFGTFNVLKITANYCLSLALVLVWRQSWEGRIAGIGLVEMSFCLLALIILQREGGLHFHLNRAYFKDILKFGLPLLPHGFCLVAMTTLDKFYLNAMYGVDVTGIYGVGFTLGSIVTMIALPIDIAAEPYIYTRLSNMDRDGALRLVVYTYLYMFCLVAAALLVWLLAPVILKVFVDPKFFGAEAYVFWVSLGYAAFCMRRILTRYITYSKKTYLITLTTVLAALVALVANYVLITLNGPVGAAQAICLTFVFYMLITWVIAGRLYPMPWLAILKPVRVRELYIALRTVPKPSSAGGDHSHKA